MTDPILLAATDAAMDRAGLAEGMAPAGPGGLVPVRRCAPSALEGTIYEPLVCLVLQGAKTVSSGAAVHTVGAGALLVVSHDLPVISRIAEATRAAPYLALVLPLDLAELRALGETLAAPPAQGTPAALQDAPCDAALADAFRRLLALRDDEADATVLAPLVTREIHYRLLTGAAGGQLRALIRSAGVEGRIAEAIARIRAGFDRPLSPADLARGAGMSKSSFHAHFRAVTATSPLQYQKDLRLLHARERLLTEGCSVSEAAFAVGYQSPTQFSRDYARRFGLPPREDRRRAA